MATTADNKLADQLLQTATNLQQVFYERCKWKIYKTDERDGLKYFIAYALFGDKLKASMKDDRAIDETFFDLKYIIYENKKQHDAINLIFNKLINYGSTQSSEGNVLCTVIYNVIYDKEKILKEAKRKRIDAIRKELEKCTNGRTTAKIANRFSSLSEKNASANKSDTIKKEDIEGMVYPIPVFKVMSIGTKKSKIKNKHGKSVTVDAETIKFYYIDNGGRVYDEFSDYAKNNKLPKCTMVLPKDGSYQADPLQFDSITQKIDEDVTKVWTEVRPSPASKITAKAAVAGDLVTSAAMLGSLGVGIVATITPLGAVIVTASAIGGILSGLWSAGRSAHQLADRGQHGESINVTNKTALGAWLGVAGGAMGAAATGAPMAIARAATAGKIVSNAAMKAHDFIIIGNLVVNGVGVGFKAGDIISTYIDEGKVSTKDVFLLTTHIFFLKNAVVNRQDARAIIENSQRQHLTNHEADLRSNRHRQEHRRLMRDTRAVGTDDLMSNAEIIRSINNIENKNEFYQAMVRNRKAFKASGAKVTYADGKVTVDSVMTIDPVKLSNLPPNARVDFVKSVNSVSSQKSAPIKPQGNYANRDPSYRDFTAKNEMILKDFCSRQSCKSLATAAENIIDFQSVLNDLRSFKKAGECFRNLLVIAYKIYEALPSERVTVGDILAIIVQFVWDYVKSKIRRKLPDGMIEDPLAEMIANKILEEILVSMEKEVDNWVNDFAVWLKIKFPQRIDILLRIKTSNYSNRGTEKKVA